MKKIAIIGSGPAGLTAGIYTSRAQIDTTIYQGTQPGGQLTTTTEIENFPGFPDGILGPELMNRMSQQAQRFGSKLELDTVQSIKKNGSMFQIETISNQTSLYDAVIVASGASAKYLGIPDEQKYIGKGYHSCATCDGFFYRDKVIAVVGGGDTASEESTFLTRFASKVYLIVRKNTLKASKIMQEKVFSNNKIEILYSTEITEFHGDEFVTSVTLKNSSTNLTSKLDLDGVFVAIGHTPNSQFAQGFLTMDELGYLIPQSRMPLEMRTSQYSTMSNVDGIFLAGDIEDKVYRQAITASGDGCRSAMECEKWLESK